jgi:hypothetical protein
MSKICMVFSLRGETYGNRHEELGIRRIGREGRSRGGKRNVQIIAKFKKTQLGKMRPGQCELV